MATFENLEVEKFYLLRIKEEDEITMVQVAMETDKCVLVYEFDDEYETTSWKKKVDTIAEIVEELTEEHLDEYENILMEDEFEEEEEEEDTDDDDDDDEDHYNGEKKKKKKKKK